MKRLFLLFFLLCGTIAYAQNDNFPIGKVSLSVDVPKDEPMSDRARTALSNKLKQIVTRHGCASDGFDERFVLTAHMQIIDESVTATIPVMEAITLAFTFYVGDSETGTLFSSWSAEVTGVGKSREESLMGAVKKISVNNPDLTAAIETGKAKIVAYYNSVGPDIIAKAEALARGGNYDEAVYTLSVIPNACNVYTTAQSLMGKYAYTALETSNKKIVANARAAWASSPDENGASRAEQILAGLEQPSAAVLAEAKALTTEITKRLKVISNREFAFARQQAQWEHDMEVQREKDATKVALAATKAAASVARAYYNSRPRVVHHVHWW